MINLALAVLVVGIIGTLIGTLFGFAGIAQSTLSIFLALLVVALIRSLITAPVRSTGRLRQRHYDHDD